ncbi:LOW QUALITY PROTEIN: MKRN1-like protein [Mya arenaria]|uniref:RING-type E3 ubiquitin transferase n=1 Tax=Mya arenaria TaxID=6604 RepID=A0ABY7G1M4_MYAAR|nr:LOW QUALITY PROTEIN: MKRN1-like protein [Mya arenaria]
MSMGPAGKEIFVITPMINPTSQSGRQCLQVLHPGILYGERCRYDHIKPWSNFQPESHKKSTPLNPVPQKSHAPISVSSSEPVTSGIFPFKKALNKEPSTPTTPKPPEEWFQTPMHTLQQTILKIPSPPLFWLSSGIQVNCCARFRLIVNARMVTSANIVMATCDLCRFAVLLPGDEKQNLEHRQQYERDMELSFAIARSKDKQCGVCMDTVLKKQPTAEQRFGILSDCSHCFCLACIRKWRASKQFDIKTIRSCPECRVQSDFVTPSAYWVDTKEDKIKLIQGYKQALGKKPCKYFDQGRGDCPFKEKCIYLHMNPDGTKAEPKPRRRRQRRNADGSLDYEERVTFWDFFQERQERLQNLLLMLEDDIASLLINLNVFSDSEEESDDDDDFLLF